MKQCKRIFIVCVLLSSFLFMHSITKADATSTYKIKVNKQQNCVTIYKLDSAGDYKPVKALICSTGWATQTGTYSLGQKMRWHTLDGPCYGQYCTRIYGGVLFHSVWYTGVNNPATLSGYSYNKLGTTASHGCVRLTVAGAKWIYDNVPSGTPVIIYNSSNPGPLGKPESIKVPFYSGGWDPTDIWYSNNPWNKKKPVISGATSQKVEFNSVFDVKKGVTAKNTTGYDVTSRIKTKIIYAGKKVKKINTCNPGNYKVTYSVKDEIGRKAKVTVKIKVTGGKETPVMTGVEDLYLKDKAKMTKKRALRDIKVTQGGKKLDQKYVSVTFKKVKKNVYKVIYVAQNASMPVKKTAKIYIDNTAPEISGLTDGQTVVLPENQELTKEYALSLVKVSDNVSKLSESDVKLTLTKTDNGGSVIYELTDQAGNKKKITVHFQKPVVTPVSGTAVSA